MIQRPARRFALIACLFGSFSLISSGDSGNPPRPSSFFGSVRVGGRSAATNLPISAWIGGQKYAEGSLVRQGEATLYLLHVPADLPETAAVEGGVGGNQVQFRLGSAAAAQTGDWLDGVHRQLALELPAGPDLRASLSDGVASAARADHLAYTLTIENTGSSAVQEIETFFDLPAYCDFESAGEGGSFASGKVSWPAAEIAAGGSLTRHVTVFVRRSAPLSVSSIEAHGGFVAAASNALDPDPSNDSARDSDTLTSPAALPNLALAFDGLEVTPAAPALAQPVQIRVTVRNTGAAVAVNPLVKVLAGELSAGGSIIGQSRLGDLEPGANRQIQLTWNAAEGATAIVAQVDPDEELLETDRLDNQREPVSSSSKPAMARPVP